MKTSEPELTKGNRTSGVARRLVAFAFTGIVVMHALTIWAQAPAETAESSEAVSPTAEQVGTNAPAIHRSAIVMVGRDVVLNADETAEAVVVIGGSALISGRVTESVVVIGGDVDVEGEVRDTVVAILGTVRLKNGAVVREVVSVGGSAEMTPGATVRDGIHEVGIGIPGIELPWLREWFVQCVIKMRPLAPQVPWVWAVAGVFLLVYLLIAVLFAKPVKACVEDLDERPIITFFIGLLTLVLVPVVIGLLAITGIGLLVVPFILAAIVFATLFGKVALLEYLGLRIGKQFGIAALQKPLVGFFVGAVLLTLLYMVPVLGLLTYLTATLWGLGAAVGATFGGLRREIPTKPPAAPPPASPVSSLYGNAPATAGVAPTPVTTASSTSGAGEGGPVAAVVAEPPAVASTQSGLLEAFAYPRGGFWERMGAGFVDLVLVSIVSGVAGGAVWPLVALAYFAAMWTWKATTVGGILLGLKVVRLDGQPVTFLVALVRSLAAAFSAVVLFLGFLWIAWDEDKQGWHDKLAGTVVIRLPRGTPLVCL